MILMFFLQCLRKIQEIQVCHDQVAWVTLRGPYSMPSWVSVDIVAEVFTALSSGFKLFDALLRGMRRHSEGTVKAR